MRQFIRLLLIPGVVGWLLGGCSEKIEPKPLTYSQLLTGTTSKSWKMVSAQIIDDGAAGNIISTAQLNDCSTDDVLTFYADAEHKFEVTQGTNICYPSEPNLYVTDTWTLVNANATLQFYIPILNGVYPWTIKNLTASTLTVEYYFTDINASYRFTFNPTTTK
ncbi:hypothetical protein [Spirosoma litoris]